MPWEKFRPTLGRVWRKPETERKSRAKRKPMDRVVMFKGLVLRADVPSFRKNLAQINLGAQRDVVGTV